MIATMTTMMMMTTMLNVRMVQCYSWKFVLVTTTILTSMTLCYCCPSAGPTEEIWSFLTGRCHEYSTFVNADAVCPEDGTGPNCTRIAELFIRAFAYLPICSVDPSRYNDFLTSTTHYVPPNKHIFWSGVYNFVTRYGERGQRATLLSNTLTGYLVDGLKFCAAPNQTGGIGRPNTPAACPDSLEPESEEPNPTCKMSAKYSFWAAASMKFATTAFGTITVMLNASTGSAFKNDTYFTRWELPYLTNNVKNANIWLVHTPGHKILETCQSSSIVLLKHMLKERNITGTCTENPTDVLWLLCWDDPYAEECRGLLSSISNGVQLSLSNIFPLILLLGYIIV